MENAYNAWVDFEWDKKPINFTKDSYGVHWGVKAEKWSSNHDQWVYHTGSSGGIHELSVSYDDSEIYGADWIFDWYSPYQIYETVGYGKQEIRIPLSHSGTTTTIKGGYFHAHTVFGGGISFGPTSLNFTSSAGDQWSWTESFIIDSERD